MNNNRRLHHSLRRLVSLHEDGCSHESLVVGLDAAMRRDLARCPPDPGLRRDHVRLRFPIDYGE
jgi:hypothetical protein